MKKKATTFCEWVLVNEISFELRMETILMLMIFAVIIMLVEQ